ncbi:MAG: hypothetical protein IJW55_10165 [Clostridia bacterium]|nr:hypothetical protein [Clostridia bacterium]MBQ7348312.1 hypothetical protein [Clostridia bacterium]
MPFSGKRFRHYHGHNRGTLKLHPAVIVGICLAVAVIITVIVGNLLNIWLDDEAYRKLTEGEETETTAAPVIQSAVRNVNAYPFTLGGNIDEVIGQTSVSVALNRTDGSLYYTSDVAMHLGMTVETEVSLFESVSELNAFVPYISGVFYPQALSRETSDLRYAVTAEESALLREFLHAGGSEILLCGLTPSADNIDELTAYVKTVKFTVEKAPVGVAIPRAVAADTNNWRLLAELGAVCDFLVLDLTAELVDESDINDAGISPAAAQIFTDCNYLLIAYDMRLLLSETQTALISTAVTQMRHDFQIIRLE